MSLDLTTTVAIACLPSLLSEQIEVKMDTLLDLLALTASLLDN